MVGKLGDEEVTPVRFSEFMGGLQALLGEVGGDAIKQTLELLDAPRSWIAVDGQRLRYRGMSGREWLSPFGKVTIRRRSYRGDGRGARSACPLDDACGMRDRFMTPDVEEMVAYASALLTANEVEQPLAKALPEGPSATAVQNAVRRLGAELDKGGSTMTGQAGRSR